MITRIQKVKDLLQEKQLDAILITTPANITYLTEFDFLSPTEREAYIIVTHANQYIISSFLYKEEVRKKAPEFRFLDISTAGGKPWWEYVKEISEKEHITHIGFESDNLTVAEYAALKKQNIQVSPLSISHIRHIKDSDEIMAMTKACAISDLAYQKIQKDIHPGMTEKEIAFLLDTYMRKQGAEPSFSTIVAFGKNAAVPHHKTQETVLKEKDLILLDFGAKIDNYCSDMTRMIFVGTPTQEETKAYSILLSSQQRAIDFLSTHQLPIPAAQVDAASREYLMKNGYPSFPHSLGHSIGIEDHDGFRLSPISKTDLVEGMVFSIEPGIYLPGEFGMRIEDIVAFTKNGPQLLTKSPRELITI